MHDILDLFLMGVYFFNYRPPRLQKLRVWLRRVELFLKVQNKIFFTILEENDHIFCETCLKEFKTFLLMAKFSFFPQKIVNKDTILLN